MKGNIINPGSLKPEKVLFKNNSEGSIFSGTTKWTEFITKGITKAISLRKKSAGRNKMNLEWNC